MVWQTSVALGTIIIAFAASCQKEPEREPVMLPAYATAIPDAGAVQPEPDAATPAAPGRVQTQEAIMEVAAARCDHEVQCQRIGAGRRYETRAACEREASNEAYQDVKLVGCDKGVDPDKLQICLDEVGDEACDAPLDTLQRIMACSARPLCTT